ncbi:EscR/YscR/HrcR family type III secretion system export apparatus protein [bacterium]|nr:EscR/YscR/HrcR family type III secretion system export apparatus protein [candidate division CSSED10-310 bacterium]
MTGDPMIQQPGIVLVFLSIVSLLPILVIATTSFVKLSVVLSLLRSALGTPQIPANTVITGLSLVLSLIVMSPVLTAIQDRMAEKDLSLRILMEGDFQKHADLFVACSREPMVSFLLKHAHEQEVTMMREMVVASHGLDVGQEGSPVLVAVAAFVLSELKEAFQIGFIIFLPFLIIDMVVANILQAMGMVMLSPTTISLPFKLLLFVLADGWHLLIQGLVAGYL